MSLLDDPSTIERNVEVNLPITEDWLRDIGMEWDDGNRSFLGSGFIWKHTINPKRRGWRIRYNIYENYWDLARVIIIDRGDEKYCHYPIKSRKEFTDIIEDYERMANSSVVVYKEKRIDH